MPPSASPLASLWTSIVSFFTDALSGLTLSVWSLSNEPQHSAYKRRHKDSGDILKSSVSGTQLYAILE